MKPNLAKLHALNNSMLALRGERWNYLLVLSIVVGLALLFVSSVMLNVYHLTMLAVASSQEMSTILQYHHEIKLDTIKPETINASDWHMFGSPPAAAVAIVSRNFDLIGIEYSYLDPSLAKAIISSKSGDEGIYRAGEKLPQGAIVEKIGPEQVTILYNGTLEVLTLKWDEEQDTGNANTQPSADESGNYQNINQEMQQSDFPFMKQFIPEKFRKFIH